jgi:hypothetical protein
MGTSDKISRECYYEQLINVRNLEVDQFWKRNVFIFGIQGVIVSFFIGSFSTLINSLYACILLISNIFGLCLAVFCLLLINTDKLWLEYYEDKVKAFEIKMNEKIVDESDKIKIFCDTEREDLKKKNTYISTKITTILISILFIIFWLVTIFFLIYLHYI